MEKTAREILMNPDPRTMRAKSFASQIMATIADFVPRDRVTADRIYEKIVKAAYDANALIVLLPLEFDSLSHAEAERQMVERIMKPFFIRDSEGPKGIDP